MTAWCRTLAAVRVGLALLLSAPLASRAAEPAAPARVERRLAVLEFRGDSSEPFRAVLADRARAAALEETRATGWVIMTRESIALLAKENGAACGEGECEVEIARSVGARLVMTGEVRKVAGMYVLDLKVHDTVQGRLVGAASAEAGAEPELLGQASSLAGKVVRASILALTPASPNVSAAPGATRSCPGPAWTCARPGPCGEGGYHGKVCGAGSADGTARESEAEAGRGAVQSLCGAVRDRLADLATRSGRPVGDPVSLARELDRAGSECTSAARIVTMWTDPDGKRTHALAVLEGDAMTRAALRIQEARAPDRQPAAPPVVPAPARASAPGKSDADRRMDEIVETWERESAR